MLVRKIKLITSGSAHGVQESANVELAKHATDKITSAVYGYHNGTHMITIMYDEIA